ncbi:MAG TPA: glycosyltransferase family 2 protein [Thermoplasmata archaeon]|nr:glycosyltransferase family 2 protein [Thermoplasmata archaeon]
MHKTLAAIPAYNEEIAIGTVVLRCRAYVDEVLVIDDGSEDRTADVARLARAIVHTVHDNTGKGAAIQWALEYAKTHGFDAMVLLDGDGQHDPGDIPELFEPVLQDEADIVIGVRERATSKIPPYRRFGQRVLDYLTAAGSRDAVTDSQSGFRTLSRRAMESLTLNEASFSVESEMLFEAKEKGLRISEVPIRARYDVEGSTKGPFSHGFGVVDGILRIVAVRHPLAFLGGLGVMLSAVGIALGFVALGTYAQYPELAIGYSFLVIIFLLSGGLAMFAGVMLNVLPSAVVRMLRRKPPPLT